MKTVFTAVEHGAIGERIVRMSDACHQLNSIIRPNLDLAQHLLNILDELQIFSEKMRDKYSEDDHNERWKKCRPFQKDA